MPSLVTAVVLAGAAGGFWLLLSRANELCAIRVEEGHARMIRGRAPARLLSDVDDIVHRAGVAGAGLRIVSESGSPRLIVSGDVSDDVAQQLRNAVGQHRVLHFRTGRRVG